GKADAEFEAALRNGIRDRAVEADGCDENGKNGEGSKERSLEARLRDGIGAVFVERFDGEKGDGFVDRSGLRLAVSDEGVGVDSSAGDEGHAAEARALREWDPELGRRPGLQILCLNVADNSDDGAPGSLAVTIA